MELAKVICLSRDEYDLIEDFILYHSKIFGFNNIVIIDNMSTNKEVLDIYARYVPMGVTVHRHDGGCLGDAQTQVLTKYLNMYKDTCQFLISMDTDEFMYCTNDDDPMAVRKVLEEIPKDTTMARISEYMWSIPDPGCSDYKEFKHSRPARSLTRFYSMENLTRKIFFRSDAFKSASPGNHYGTVTYGSENFVPIGWFHFYNTGARRMFERSMMIVRGMNYVDVNLSHSEQYIRMYTRCPWKTGYSFEKQQLYMFFLFKYLIIEYYKMISGKPPPKDHMKYFVDNYFLKGDIHTLFTDLDAKSKIAESDQNRVDSAFAETKYDWTKTPPYSHEHEVTPSSFTKTIVSEFLSS
jgi:hypothetical protein